MRTYFSCKLENGGKTGFYIVILTTASVHTAFLLQRKNHEFD